MPERRVTVHNSLDNAERSDNPSLQAILSGPKLPDLGPNLPIWAETSRSGPKPFDLGPNLPIWA